MTTTDTEVTQADRNAAEPILGPASQTCSADHPVLQILARHRTLTPAQAAGPVNQCEMPEVAAMRYIETLRGDIAASVTILCDNEEAWTKDEQLGVEVIAEWTDWKARRFMGESVIQCLARAVTAREVAIAQAEGPQA